jgi:light-independent protochlorophyllide reductase subunit B
MQLTLWTYEGPPHVGAMRVAASMTGVHYVLHAPQGDTYADLLFTMIERNGRRPPVTYTTFQARDLGGDTAGLVVQAVRDAAERFRPDAMLVGESCTAELIQDQPGSLAKTLGLTMPVVPLELPSYSKKENWGAAETFYQLVRTLCLPLAPAPGTPRAPRPEGRRPRAAVLGPTALGFRGRDDVRELRALLDEAGVDAHVVAPLGATVADLRRLPECDLVVCYAAEIAGTACEWLRRTFGLPVVKTVPIGVGATRDFLREAGGGGRPAGARVRRRRVAPAVVLALGGLDVPHRQARVRVRRRHARRGRRPHRGGGAGLRARGARHLQPRDGARRARGRREVRRRGVRERRLPGRGGAHRRRRAGARARHPDGAAHGQAARRAVRGDLVAHPRAGRAGSALPAGGLGGRERDLRQLGAPAHDGAGGAPAAHVPRRLRVPRRRGAVAPGGKSAPAAAAAPAGRSPSLAAAGDHEALLEALAAAPTGVAVDDAEPEPEAAPADAAPRWRADAEAELRKIPFFVRGKARRNTERYAADRGVGDITVDTLYEAKAHYAR